MRKRVSLLLEISLQTLILSSLEIGMTEKPLSLENTENFDFKELGKRIPTSGLFWHLLQQE